MKEFILNLSKKDKQLLLQTIVNVTLNIKSIIKDNGNSIKCQTANGVNYRSKDTV